MLEKIKQIFRTKWEEIYTTQDQRKYFAIMNTLSDNNIESKTGFDASTINSDRIRSRTSRTYTILVRVEDVSKAVKIIQGIRR